MLSLSFLRTHARLLGFGVLMTFCSSVGQTFFISLFSGQIRADYGLSDGEFGSLYSLGTLASATVLLGAGRLIDRVPLQLFAAGVLALLAAVCLLMGAAGDTVLLVAALFGLRLFGQGLASHSAIVAMGRYFEAARGRAVSVVTLGHTLGEATLPALAVAALALAGWRQVWSGTALILLALVPLVFVLLRGQGARDAAFREAREAQRLSAAETGADPDRTLGAALRDGGLWLRLPALLAPPFIGTGLIFHQVHLCATKGWPLSLMAGAFTVFAGCSLAALMLAGPLVDRFGARRLVALVLAPITAACLVLAASDNPLVATLFMGLLGLTTGGNAVIMGALWPELYGVTHLGAIRAFATSAVVFSTGLAPAVMGFFIDGGVTMEAIAVASALYCLAAAGLAVLAVLAGRPRPVLR